MFPQRCSQPSPCLCRRKRFFKFLLILVSILVFCRAFLFNPNPSNLNTDFDVILTPSTSPSKPMFLVIFVISSSTNVLARYTIRNTWANGELKATSSVPWMAVFVLGKPSDAESQGRILQETKENGDILQGDFFDTARALPLKTIMALRWALHARSEYILKTDDDMYVYVPRLINWLRARDPAQLLYAGKRRENAFVVRFRFEKYPVAYEEFAEAKYPYYCYGGFYILSGKMMPKLMEAHRKHRLFPVEDAYVGVLARYIGVTPINIYPRYLMLERYSRWRSIDYHKCIFADVFAFGDSVDPETMLHIHRSMENLVNPGQNGLSRCIE